MEPSEGKTIEYGDIKLKLAKILAKTSRSQIWELENINSKRGIMRFICKFTNLDVYPDIKKLIESGKNIKLINDKVKNEEVDYNQSKKIAGFANKTKFYAIEYSLTYNMIYTISTRYDGNLTTYPNDPLEFLKRFLVILRNLHLRFYTSNNISPNDIMWNTEGQIVDFYLIDYKNLALFGTKPEIIIDDSTYLSLNILTGGVPTFYDDLESLFYVYCFLNKISFPIFRDTNSNIEAKKELLFLPEIIRNIIFLLRNQDKFLLINYNDQMQGDVTALINYIYDGIEMNMIQQLQNIGPLIITNERFKPSIEEERNILPSELALLKSIKEDIVRLNYIPNEGINSFAQKVVEFLLRDQKFNEQENKQILNFLEIIST